MSVLVKDMEMPNACVECIFHRYHNLGEYVCVATSLLYPMNLANYKCGRKDFCPLVDVPIPHGDLVDLSDTVHPNDSMRLMAIDEQLRRTCEGWSADRKQYVVIKAEERHDQ